MWCAVAKYRERGTENVGFTAWLNAPAGAARAYRQRSPVFCRPTAPRVVGRAWSRTRVRAATGPDRRGGETVSVADAGVGLTVGLASEIAFAFGKTDRFFLHSVQIR